MKFATLLAALALSASLPATVFAEVDDMARNQTRIDPGVRYPGDVAFKEGTIRMSGPEKGPYVERCTWSFRTSGTKGFGLTQSCMRYTLDNTPVKN